MSEILRILNKWDIQSDYLKNEIINDFLVTEKQKKIWLIELDLLSEFDRVCKKYDIPYYLMYGSLLGAIRHKGFIPWDDDIDVGIFRSDYDKLTEVAIKEFRYPYFFQTPHTDSGSCFSMARLRNSETTALIEAFRYEKFNQGIVLDIFPIDNVDIECQEDRAQKIKEMTLAGSAYMRRNNPNPTEHDLEILKNNFIENPILNFDNLQVLCSEFNNKDTKYVGTRIVTTYPWEKMTFFKEDFSSVIYVDFGWLKVPIPIGYDRILKTTYGDYMEFPPLESRGNWHTRTTTYDPDHSYINYLK